MVHTTNTTTGQFDVPVSLPSSASSSAVDSQMKRTTSESASRGRAGASPKTSPRRGRKPQKVNKRDLLSATMQMAIMARTGVDLDTALRSLAKQSRSPGLSQAFQQVHAEVSEGSSVSDALRRQSHVFGETYVASVAAGEASGKLADVLQQLTQLQRSELRLHNTLRTLLGYPLLLASVSSLVLAALVFFVLPQFAEIFADFETPLPVMTRLLLAVSEELRNRYWLWGVVAIGAGFGGYRYLKSESGRRRLDRLMINVRVLRDVTRCLLVGRAFRLLGTMLDSGVPLIEGLAMVRSSVRNSLVKDAFTAIEDDVLNGRGMASSLLAADVVPDTAAEMVATAERTGSLAMVANLIGEHLEEEGESQLRTLVALLEPAIIIVMGALVACVVLSVMLPMFDLATLAQSGA
jgi:type II secretory pathway component PulF